MNYREHADEAGYPPDSLPVTFTKFPSSLTGPDALVTLPEGNVDWEVELVIAIGRGGHRIEREEAWNHVAGLTIGQDLSERVAQLEGTRPQFSLASRTPASHRPGRGSSAWTNSTTRATWPSRAPSTARCCRTRGRRG